jgi:phosphatidylserine/phosphatidylglycerophosphate/cardiolipin synthase-like enzyme
MQWSQVDEILAQSVADRRLSGNEKNLLRELLSAAKSRELAHFRHRAFQIAAHAMADPHSSNVLHWLEDVIKLTAAGAAAGAESTTARAYFSPGDDCPTVIAGLLGRARRTIDVCVFTITDDRVSSALLNAHRRGVRIRVMTDNEKTSDTGSDIDRLAEAGIQVREDRSAYHMHHKFAILDGTRLLTGSYNWTRGAAEHNAENFIVTSDRSLVTLFSREFERLWQEFA